MRPESATVAGIEVNRNMSQGASVANIASTTGNIIPMAGTALNPSVWTTVPGMPSLSDKAQAELDAANDKWPRAWKAPPVFDIASPWMIPQWLEAIEALMRGKFTLDEAKVRQALDWCTF